MPPKGKKGSGKKKKQQLSTKPEHLQPFGVQVCDVIQTPLGVRGKVLGVKPDAHGAYTAGRLIVEYASSQLVGPLEPSADALAGMGLQDMGYTVLQGGDLLQHKLAEHRLAVQVLEEQRYLAQAATAAQGSTAALRKKLAKSNKKAKAREAEG